jgi:hypothetical protein
MYCPNCGTNNQAEHNYCRSCGLKLDEISRNVAEQFPSLEYAALIRRKERFEKLGLVSLSITAVIGLSMILYKVGAYKAELFGAAALLWSAFGAFALFGLLAVFFFNYPKVFMNFDKANPRLEPNEPAKPIDTQKLIEDRLFEPASVTEHSTELLEIPRKD